MRVNILNNNVISIDFDTVDQVIDFIKKFNSSNSITGEPNPIKIDPNDWKQPWNPYNPVVQPLDVYYRKIDKDAFKVTDPVPDTYTVTATNIK